MSRPAHWLFAAALLIPIAGCGDSSDTAEPAAGATAGSAGGGQSSPAASSAAPSAPGPSTGAAPGGADQGQCPVTPQELEAATRLTWKLGRTLPKHPLEYEESITGVTCVFIAEAAAVKDDYGQPLIMRIDVATGADATALEKYNLRVCGQFDPGKLRAPRGGGGGKVCDIRGSVSDGFVVKDGSTVSVLTSSDSKKILKDFSPAFEAAIATLAD